MIIGGDGGGGGGGSGSKDGRGGKGARGPTEKLGFNSAMWGYGRGGSGANHAEFDRRVKMLCWFTQEYKARFPDDAVYINAGIEAVPAAWVNQRLFECGERWLVSVGEYGYVLPSLPPDIGDLDPYTQ
jgi:hypothetical protein